MAKLVLLFSHKLTPLQKLDAKQSLGVKDFVELPLELQHIWSNVPSDLEELSEYLEPIFNYLKEVFEIGDVALIQGDFGATCKVVTYAKALGFKAVYATTKRDVVETQEGNKVVKRSIFKHVRFRAYG